VGVQAPLPLPVLHRRLHVRRHLPVAVRHHHRARRLRGLRHPREAHPGRHDHLPRRDHRLLLLPAVPEEPGGKRRARTTRSRLRDPCRPDNLSL